MARPGEKAGVSREFGDDEDNRVSSYRGGGDHCIEVALRPSAFLSGTQKDTGRQSLTVSRLAWSAFRTLASDSRVSPSAATLPPDWPSECTSDMCHKGLTSVEHASKYRL